MGPWRGKSQISRMLGIVSALALLGVVHPSFAQTAEAPGAGKRERTRADMLGFRLRLHGPFAAWTLINWGKPGESLETSLGASAAIEIIQWFTVELAGSYFSGSEWSVRAGPVVPVLDARNDESAGWVLQVPVLPAYRYLDRSEERDSCRGHEMTSAVAVNVGLEATQWLSPWFGWSVRGLLGVTGAIEQTRTGCWKDYLYFGPEDNLDYAMDAGVQFGIAF